MGRQRIRRHVASDIEEDDVMQDGTADEQEDEEVEVKSKTVKKEKGKGKEKASEKRRRVEEDQSDGQDEEEETEAESDDNAARVDVTNFKDQPIRAEAHKLHGLSTDWKEMDRKIQQSWSGVRQVAVALAGTAEDEGEKSLGELDKIMRELIDVSAEMNSHEQALDKIYQSIGKGEDITDAMDRYQDAVKAKAREYSQKTTRQKYAKNEQYVKFKENIYGVLYPDMPMRPMTELIPREDGDASDDEDDLEVGGITQDYKCPLTLIPFVNPLTSTVCQHSFSGDALRAYFDGARVPKKCPASGCTKLFRLSDCQPDRELAKRVKIWARRKQRDEEHSDAEEVVE